MSFAHEEEKTAPPFPRPPEKEITVEAQPWVKNCAAEPYIEADFIYWKVKQEGLGYAVTGFGDANQPVDYKGKIYHLDFEGSPGFRAGVGVNIAHDGWDVALRYTWMHSNAEDKTTAASNELLLPIWTVGLNPVFINGMEEVSAKWDLHLNILDLEWGRHFYVSRYSTLRPFFGLKGYWMDQDYKVDERGLIMEVDPGLYEIDLDYDGWGFGARLGLNTSWYLTRNWSAFGNIALSSCWSRFYTDRKDTSGEMTYVHSRYKEFYMVPILELMIGVRWEMWFADDHMHALIQAGWEEQVWWGTARYIISEFNDQSKGNLAIHGLTLRFRFDF